jgi:hypothetical protein
MRYALYNPPSDLDLSEFMFDDLIIFSREQNDFQNNILLPNSDKLSSGLINQYNEQCGDFISIIPMSLYDLWIRGNSILNPTEQASCMVMFDRYNMRSMLSDTLYEGRNEPLLYPDIKLIPMCRYNMMPRYGNFDFKLLDHVEEDYSPSNDEHWNMDDIKNCIHKYNTFMSKHSMISDEIDDSYWVIDRYFESSYIETNLVCGNEPGEVIHNFAPVCLTKDSYQLVKNQEAIDYFIYVSNYIAKVFNIRNCSLCIRLLASTNDFYEIRVIDVAPALSDSYIYWFNRMNKMDPRNIQMRAILQQQ